MSYLRTEYLTVNIGKKYICHELDFNLQAGEVWGILGPNGVGKTTLLHALAGLHPSKEGNIYLHEERLGALSMKQIARTVGLLFQDNQDIFPQTVYEYCRASRFPHLAYFEKESARDHAIVQSALQTMELDRLSAQPVTQLSGGEKRRTALAGILAQTPEIYLLDEPTNHLDVRHQIKTLQHFRDLATQQSAAVMMSLHDPNHAQQFCDHVMLMFSDGEILQGLTSNMLTVQHLTRLYGLPMSASNTSWRFDA